MASSSRSRTARMRVLPVQDKDAVIKELREENTKLEQCLDALHAAKVELEEYNDHLQVDVKRFAYYHEKAEEEHDKTKEILAAAQAEIAELKAQREQFCFTAVQRHQQDASTIQELQHAVQNLEAHNHQLAQDVHHLQVILWEPEVEAVVPIENEAEGDGEVLDS